MAIKWIEYETDGACAICGWRRAEDMMVHLCGPIRRPMVSIAVSAAVCFLLAPTILAQDAAGWISDFSVLSGLTSLTFLQLTGASITDISPLSGLASLTDLDLNRNVGLRNIQPLLDNPGLGAGDTVDLSVTSVSCMDVAALEGKGVTVTSDCGDPSRR